MTDNEIIKALELCIDDVRRCGECPYFGIPSDGVPCGKQHGIDMLDLINRQKAEIERLHKDNEYILMQHKFQRRPSGDCWNDVIEKAKVEAIKEFAERLKEKAFPDDSIYTRMVVEVEDIDNLVKEMTEDKT